MFQIGDIFSKHYKAINFKRYFLIIDEPYHIQKKTYSYLVMELDDGSITTYNIDHSIKNKLYPIIKEA